MSKAKPIGPQLPADASDRNVWGDYLLERGFGVPWEISTKKKATKVRGSALASSAAGLMAKLAEAQATLANLDTQRVAAEETVEAVEKQLEAIGIDSLRDLRRLDARREYRICSHPDCQRVDVNSWRDEVEPWWCDEHESEAEKERKAAETRALMESLKNQPKEKSNA